MISLKRCDLDLVPSARHWMLTFGDEDRIALRMTMGNLSRRGRYHKWVPDVFVIRGGRRA
jgi:hypothetical protein